MENFGSSQDELYYTAKNFNKLKFSNKAYIDSTQKEKEDNQTQIEKLKKEYERMKNEVAQLRKTCLYVPGRVKSANNSEYAFYCLKLDQAKHERDKSAKELNKIKEKCEYLEIEAKLISDDNNPYVKRIKLLENKLDKAMIKYNEAMSIRRTYEQILARLKEERAGYDNQIAAIQKSLKEKGHDLSEFKLLLQDSSQAKAYSQNLVKNTEKSKEQFDKHFRQLIAAQQNENRREMKEERNDAAKKIKNKKNENYADSSEEKAVINKDYDLEKELKILEDNDKLVRETTGADDINEICQKYSNLRETKDNLKGEQKDFEKRIDALTEKKQKLEVQLKQLKYESQDEITRKEIEDHENKVRTAMNLCDKSRAKLKKEERLMVDITSGIDNLTAILKEKIFEEMCEEPIERDRDISIKEEYKGIFDKKNDLKIVLAKMNEVFKYLQTKVEEIKNDSRFEDENNKLDRKEENEIENIYLPPKVDTNEESEYGPEEDNDPEIPSKEHGNRNDFESAFGDGKKKYDYLFNRVKSAK